MTAIKKNITNFWAALGKHGNKLVIHSYSEESIWFFFLKPKGKCQLQNAKEIKRKCRHSWEAFKKVTFTFQPILFSLSLFFFFWATWHVCLICMKLAQIFFFFPLLASDNLGIWNTQHFCVCVLRYGNLLLI